MKTSRGSHGGYPLFKKISSYDCVGGDVHSNVSGTASQICHQMSKQDFRGQSSKCWTPCHDDLVIGEKRIPPVLLAKCVCVCVLGGLPALKEHNKSPFSRIMWLLEGGQWSIWKSLLQTWWHHVCLWRKHGPTHNITQHISPNTFCIMKSISHRNSNLMDNSPIYRTKVLPPLWFKTLNRMSTLLIIMKSELYTEDWMSYFFKISKMVLNSLCANAMQRHSL